MRVDEKWCADTGIVFAVLMLFFGRDISWAFPVTLVILLLVLIYPRALWPLGFLWKIIAETLSFVVPRLFFGLVFAIIIAPIGLTRRALGVDSLMLKSKKYDSAFKKRDHAFGAKDLIMPF